MVQYLLIVARNQSDLWRYLKDNFAADQKVEVILDRRRAERRQRIQPQEPERRQGERRRRPSIDNDLSYRFFVIIRRPQGVLSGRLPGWKETA